MTADLVLEWTGAVLGLIGAFLLALNIRISRYAWVVLLLSNFVLIAFAYVIHRNGFLLMQCGFLVTSLVGLARNGLLSRPRRHARAV